MFYRIRAPSKFYRENHLKTSRVKHLDPSCTDWKVRVIEIKISVARKKNSVARINLKNATFDIIRQKLTNVRSYRVSRRSIKNCIVATIRGTLSKSSVTEFTYKRTFIIRVRGGGADIFENSRSRIYRLIFLNNGRNWKKKKIGGEKVPTVLTNERWRIKLIFSIFRYYSSNLEEIFEEKRAVLKMLDFHQIVRRDIRSRWFPTASDDAATGAKLRGWRDATRRKHALRILRVHEYTV